MQKERGFIHIILIAIVIIALLVYFHVDLRALADKYQLSPWATYVWQQIMNFWNQYCQPAFAWALSFVVVPKGH